MRSGLPNFTGVILAAGGSSRMGNPKALLDWNGQPLLTAHCQAFTLICSRVIVMIGSQHQLIQTVIPDGVDIKINPKWDHTHMADSLRLALSDVDGPCLVTPVDTPPAPLSVLKQITQQDTPTVPTFKGHDGHPVWVDARPTVQMLNSLTLQHALRTASRTEIDWPGCVDSWNTPAEWAAYVTSSDANRLSKRDS